MRDAAHLQGRLAQSAVVVVLALLTFTVLWFAGLGYRNLNEPDEGRYAEIPREMVASGDWLTPHLNGLKYFEKPPLQYWATAAAFEAFGQSNATARLWSALLGLVSVVWTFFVGARLFDRRAGVYAACLLGSCLMWVALGHLNTLDMGVSAFLTFGIGALALAQARRDDPVAERNWMLLGWAMLAAATLSKGLIGVVLPGGAVVLYSLWQRDWALWRHLHIGKGLLLFLILTAPWFIAVSRAKPDFLWFFFVHEHFLRYITREADRVEPWWYFLVLLWGGFLPWLGSGLRAVLKPGFRWSGGNGGFDAVRLLWTYGVFVIVFFSASDSKLAPYILPVYPAFAWLAGRALANRGPLRSDVVAAWVLGVVFLLLTFNLHWFTQDDLPLAILARTRPWLVGAGCVMLLGGVAAWRLRAAQARALALALAALLGFQLLNWGYQALSPIYSARALALALAPAAAPGVPVYSVNFYEQSLPFYLKRTLHLVSYRGELGFGLDHDRGAGIPTLARFATIWRSKEQALAVMQIQDYDRLKAMGLPMRVIFRDPRRVAVARR